MDLEEDINFRFQRKWAFVEESQQLHFHVGLNQKLVRNHEPKEHRRIITTYDMVLHYHLNAPDEWGLFSNSLSLSLLKV